MHFKFTRRLIHNINWSFFVTAFFIINLLPAIKLHNTVSSPLGSLVRQLVMAVAQYMAGNAHVRAAHRACAQRGGIRSGVKQVIAIQTIPWLAYAQVIYLTAAVINIVPCALLGACPLGRAIRCKSSHLMHKPVAPGFTLLSLTQSKVRLFYQYYRAGTYPLYSTALLLLQNQIFFPIGGFEHSSMSSVYYQRKLLIMD